MPIKGLTDNVMPRFPRLGRLRKGGEKQQKNGKETYGKDLTYFRFTSERPEITKAFHDAYGAQPAVLHVYLPYASLDDNFDTWKEHWVKGGMRHRCDGVTCTVWLGPDGKYHTEPKPCPGGCDEVGRLTVILPELIRAGFVGYVTLQTGSINDLANITASLKAVAEARKGNPLGLQGIEFVLRRQPEMISTPGWGDDKASRQRVEKWLVSIEPVPTWAETQLRIAARSVAVIGAPPVVATASGLVDANTGEVLQPPDDMEGGEFSPPIPEDAPEPQAPEPTDGDPDTAANWWDDNIASQPSPAAAQTGAGGNGGNGGNGGAPVSEAISDKQLALLEKLLKQVYPDGDTGKFNGWLVRVHGVTDIQKLTKRQAIAVIDVLKQRTSAAPSPAASA